MESNSDIFIKSESLSIKIPKHNISDSELEISDSPINSLLSEGMEYISDISTICDRNSPVGDTTGREYPQIEFIYQREEFNITPLQFIDENLTPTPPPPKEYLDDSIPPPPIEENLTPTPPPPEEDSTSSDENQAPVLNLYLPTSPNELRIQIQNVDQINEGTEPKINLLREIGSSILLISVMLVISV
jgi:hypothetical protein